MAAKKQKAKALKAKAPAPPIDADESRAAVALTVAWMLTLLSTAAAMAVASAAWAIMLAFPPAAGQGHALGLFPGTLTFVAAATGTLCLILTFFTTRVRRSPAPRSITIAAVLIGAAPWIIIAALALRG